MLDDCSNYLDGTIYNLQQKLLGFEEQEHQIQDMINQTETDDYGMPKRKGGVSVNAYGMDADSPYEGYDQYGY